MKTLNFEQMENLHGGKPTDAQIGCGIAGLVAGITAGMNPIVGGLMTWGCLLTVRSSEK